MYDLVLFFYNKPNEVFKSSGIVPITPRRPSRQNN